MSESPQPRNRKERRAAARAAGEPLSSARATRSATKAAKLDFSQEESSEDGNGSKKMSPKDLGIPMKRPDYDARPQGKTLYDLAEERMRELQRSGKPVSSLEGEEVEFPMGGTNTDDDDAEFGPAAEALLYAFTMTVMHFTLDVLVHNQYREDMDWGEIWGRSARVAPILWFTVYLFKTETAMRFARLRQVVFLAAAVASGCYCVYMGNMYGYYAVMKRAPPVGTLWIWTVVEMQLPFAATSVAAVFLYTWWNKFGLY